MRYALTFAFLMCVLLSAFEYLTRPPQTTEYITYTVCYQDTVWNIAEHYSGMQVKPFREFVHDIVTVNKLKGKHIYPGDQLRIPLTVWKLGK